MKQVIQSYKSGKLEVVETPSPQVRPSSVLVRTLYSAISAGTEKTKVDTARMSLLNKARSRPDLVKKVIAKARAEGILSTYQMVKTRLDSPMPLGYSSVGIVEEVGEWVEGIQVGDTVACAGAGSANHAEYNVVPGRLVARCPEGTPLDQAAFTTIGSIALQGVRQADPKLGEKIVVLGMGLIGQIAGHLLKANGCEVFAIDLSKWKLDQAQSAGAADHIALANDPQLLARVMEWSRGRGADAVLLTASTSSNGPIETAGELCRDKGRVVIVGAVGTQFPREPYYMKEIDIRIARSYGPGRYDPLYEELGLDYPVGFVRFTEQRNMETFLDLLAQKRINLSSLITHRFQIENAEDAFNLLSAGESATNYLGIVLDYAQKSEAKSSGSPPPIKQSSSKGAALDIGFIGLGNYATAQLIPAIQKVEGAKLHSVATGSGVSGTMKSRQYNFERIETDPIAVAKSPDVGTVFIATRHDTHAKFVTEALSAGKNVFVEKPLCLYSDELDQIQEIYERTKGILCVGFNRRFAPHVQTLKKLFPNGASHLLYRVNAGQLPAEHWLKIAEVGGGRIVGEGCHFVDLCSYLGGAPISSVFAKATHTGGSPSASAAEDVHITLTLANGAVATILYLSNGNPKLAKEYLEVHGSGQSAVLKDFVTLEIAGKPAQSLKAQDKGQKTMIREFLAACQNQQRHQEPIPAKDLWNTTSATFAVLESLRTGRTVEVARS